MGPRTGAAEVTAGFDCAWASFSPRLVRMLVARGADRHAAEEVAQETGFRMSLNPWAPLDGLRARRL